MQYQADHLVQLPPQLRSKFDELERRLWRLDTLLAVTGALSGLLVSYTLLFISDRFWDTPVWLRLLFTALGVAVLVYFTFGWLRLWVWQRRDTRALAKIVQQRYRRLGDRLLGIVELADQDKRPANFSPALCQAAIQQVSAEAMNYEFRQAVATRKPRIYSLLAVVLFLLVAAPCLLVPEASANAFLRWLLPLAPAERFTFIALEDVPEKLVVPHGEPFSIRCGIRVRSDLVTPTTASFQYDRQPVVQAPVVDRKVTFNVPAQTQPGRLRLRVGDETRIVWVEPTHRPALKQMTALVKRPDYLQYPDLVQEVRNGRLTAVEGSLVVLTGKTSRAIAKAHQFAGQWRPLKVQGEDFITEPLTVTGENKLVFVWEDQHGLSNRVPATVSLGAVRDNPPVVEMPELGRAVAVLEDEILAVRISSTDDYGVKNVGVSMEITLPQKPEAPQARKAEVRTGGHQEKRLEGTYQLAPELLRAPAGSMIALKATSLDYYPGRAPAESVQHRIFVMSKEEHAKLILEELEKLRAAIEELTRRQENLLSDTRLVKDMKPEQMMREETAKQLAEQAAEQAEYARQLERLAQENLKTAREAMRNKSISEESIKEMLENTEIMQQISRQNMSPASQSLAQAQQSQSQPQRSQQVQQGEQQEQQALENLQDLQKKMAATQDKMQAKSLADRLRAIGQYEKTTAEELKKSLPKTIGLSRDQLPPEIRRDFLRMHDEQARTSKQVIKLREEIQRFAQRTGSERHEEVDQQMNEAKAAETVAQIGELIRENVSSMAMAQSQEIAEKFFDWAKKLEGDKTADSGGGGGGGGGGQQMSEEDLEKMLALLRIRETQENLREHTRLVDRFRKGTESYPEDTQKLSGKQRELSRELGQLKKDRIFQKARPMMDHANEAMDDAEAHLKRPRTDEPTYNAQTDAMNLLDEAIRSLMPSQQSGQGQSQGQMAMMQMMQMMAMGLMQPQQGENQGGQQPGGNNFGGPSDRPNAPFVGDVRGRVGPSRTVERVAGSSTRQMPAEFREALQHYFNAVEQANP
ncbi:MAG: hypothetical protein N3J91_03595 [Verrucomicrobiae bacterium]|nr:hypothetical protein [Verrucomicrobiae bacterium]